MNGASAFMGIAGASAVLIAFFAYQAWNDFRFGARKRAWLYALGIVPLFALGAIVTVVGTRYPTANFWGNAGFGAGWLCENRGRGAAQVCARDPAQGSDSVPPGRN